MAREPHPSTLASNQGAGSPEVPVPVYSEGLAVVRVGRAYGYRDTAGRLAVEPRFEHAEAFSGGRAAVLVGSKWGYIDPSGKEAIPPGYDWAAPFREGRAAVAQGGVYRFIDTAGDSVGRLVFADVRPFSSGLAAVRFGDAEAGAWGFIDARGRLAIPPLFADVPRGFSEGYAAVTVGREDGRRMGFIDSSGGFAMDSLFDLAGDFSEGVAPVAGNGSGRGAAGPWRFVDPTGARAFPGDWAWAGPFREGRAPVRGREGGLFLIDRAGIVVARLPDSAGTGATLGGRVTYRLPRPGANGDGRGDAPSR